MQPKKNFRVYLERKSTGSTIELVIKAHTDEDAKKTAEGELIGWVACGATVTN